MANGQWSRRDFFKRSAAVGAVAIGGPAVLSACTTTGGGGGGAGGGQAGGSVLDKVKKQGYIEVGIAGEVPYGFTKNGEVTGEAPEVAKAVFKNLGVKEVRAHQVDFNQLIPGLTAGQYDMVAAGMGITPDRCKQAQYSVPDYSALVAFLVPKGNPKHVMTFEDVKKKGVKLAVESGALEKGYATSVGVPSSQMVSFSSPQELLQAVTTGRAYCAVLTDISFKHLVKQNAGAPVEVAPGFKPVIDGKKIAETGGFVFRKDEDELVKAFNGQLKKLHENGQWLQIVKPFGFTKANLPDPNLTTQELCQAS